MLRPRKLSLIPLVAVAVLSVWADLYLSADDDRKTPPAQTMNGLPLLFSDDFESGDAATWEPTDAKAWKIVDLAGNRVFSQHLRRSDYDPPVRSPFNRATVKEIVVGSFVLDLQVQSTVPDYGHRDLCLFFGYQDASHFYYVHLGKRTDDRANQVFIVDNRPPAKISKTKNAGTNWDDQWHHVRIVREVRSGSIAVYFDDMQQPVMTADDKTFPWGRVGIGSFDDTGNFDDVLLYGEKVDPPK